MRERQLHGVCITLNVKRKIIIRAGLNVSDFVDYETAVTLHIVQFETSERSIVNMHQIF